MKLNKYSFLSLVALSTLLTACGGDSSNHDFDTPIETVEAAPPHGPIFDPANSKIPATNDLLFQGSVDGTLNIPNPDNNPLIAAINQLDGFSTSNPVIADFGMPIDPTSLTIGNSIRVFEVTKNAQGAVTGVVREVTAAEMVPVPLGGVAKTSAMPTDELSYSLALVPRVPLKSSTSYLVILTNKIKGTDGNPAQAPSAYSLARSSTPLIGTDYEALEPLRQLINNMEAVATSQGVQQDNIILSWSFTTQSISNVLDTVAANTTAGDIAMVSTGFNTSQLQPAGIDYEGLAFAGMADVQIGTLKVPYYLEAPSAENPTATLTGYWKGVGGSALTRFNPNPVQNTSLNIPIMMTVPNENSGQLMPESGWPIIIYQHGITRVRTDMLIYADNLAKAGFALIAMDLPLHGITDKNNPFHASNTPFPDDVEPTFDVDFIDNTTKAPGPDGVIDASGDHYINLQSLLTGRDNTRQGVANLLVLRRSLADLPNIDANRVGFIAHSLGGIVGVTYLAMEENSMPSALLTTGASITTIMRDSAFYGPVIKGSLAAAGVSGADYEKFLQGAQWVLDSSDPVNFAMQAATMHPIYMSEVVGNGGLHLPDQTVPNSSTELLAALIGAQPATLMNNPIAIGMPKIVRFTQGDHSSILDPTDDAPPGTTYINVFREMHAELESFQTSNGTNVTITDFEIIKK